MTGLLSTGALGGTTSGSKPAGTLTSAVGGLTGGSGTGVLSNTGGGLLAPVTTTLGTLVKK